MHEFFDNDNFSLLEFRLKIEELLNSVDNKNLLTNDFLNPYGFEIIDKDENIIKKDLKRFYFYLKGKNKLNERDKLEIFQKFIQELKFYYPILFKQISIFILENSSRKIIKNINSFNAIGDQGKLICINFIETNKELIDYYSDYIIATLPGFAFGKTIEFKRFELSFTKNIRAIQLYIMIESLFGKYLILKPSHILKDILNSHPSNNINSYFIDVPLLYDFEQKIAIQSRLKNIYNEVSSGTHLVLKKIQDINDDGFLEFEISKKIYNETHSHIKDTYNSYGKLSSLDYE